MIFRGPFADVDVPEVPLSDFVLGDAAGRANKAALIDGPSGRTITYGELSVATRSLAAGLSARRFSPGDTAAIFAPNVPEYAIAFHGIAPAGGTARSRSPQVLCAWSPP